MRSCLRTVLLLALACCAGLAPSSVVSACSEACAASGHCGNGGLLPGAVLTDLEALDMALQNEQGRVAQAPWTAGRPVLSPVMVKHLIPLMYQCYAEMLQDIAADNDPASLQKTYQEYTRQENLPQAQQKMFQAYSGQTDVLAVIQRLMLLQGRVQDPQSQIFTNAINSLLHAPGSSPSETPAERLKGAYARAWKLRFVASAPGAAQQIASTDAFIRNILPVVRLDQEVQSIKTTLKQNIASGTYDAALEQRIAALPPDRRNEVEEFRKQEQAAKDQQVREARFNKDQAAQTTQTKSDALIAKVEQIKKAIQAAQAVQDKLEAQFVSGANKYHGRVNLNDLSPYPELAALFDKEKKNQLLLDELKQQLMEADTAVALDKANRDRAARVDALNKAQADLPVQAAQAQKIKKELNNNKFHAVADCKAFKNNAGKPEIFCWLQWPTKNGDMDMRWVHETQDLTLGLFKIYASRLSCDFMLQGTIQDPLRRNPGNDALPICLFETDRGRDNAWIEAWDGRPCNTILHLH